MAFEFDAKSGEFEVTYQAPFGGLDSTAYPSAINPVNFPSMSGIYIEDNIINPISFQELISETFSTLAESFLMYVPLTRYYNDPSSSNVLVGYVISDKNLYPVIASVGALTLGAAVPYAPALGGSSQYSHFIVIDDIQTGMPSVYWTSQNWTEIWGYNAVTNTISQTTSYCGGGILGLLNNQLLNLGGNSAADGATPNRISWSAPGQYGQFQPYDVGSGTGNYAAGFNDLPSTSDVITGFAAIGTVGYIFRYQGITQMNPTGNGIQPFSFNHLWASQLGIGAVLPYSIAQYGAAVAFATNDGLFTLSLNGLSNIGLVANTIIFNALNNAVPLSGSIQNFTYVPQCIIVPYILNSPDVLYILAVQILIDAVYYWHVFGVRINDSKVYDFGLFQIPVAITELPVLQLAFIPAYTIETGTSQPSLRLKVLFITSGARVGTGTGLFAIHNLSFLNNSTGTLNFRKEQMKFGQWPTVNKVGVLAALLDTTVNGTISISVDGGLTFNTAFPDIVITPGGTNENGSPAGTQNPGNGIIDTIFSDGIQTLERPQLVLKLTNVQLAQAWYKGILEDYPVI